MELTDITTSLKISKRLKEKGLKQDSLFYWTGIDIDGVKPSIVMGYVETLDCYSAHTAEEWLELLPEYILIDNTAYYLFMNLHKEFHVEYKCNLYFEDKKFADALGLMWEYLTDNKLMEVRCGICRSKERIN